MNFQGIFWMSVVTLMAFFEGFSQTEAFNIYSNARMATIFYDAKGNSLDSISANLLADDIERTTGHRPEVKPVVKKVSGHAILIGTINSSFIQKHFYKKTSKHFLLQKESYVLQLSKDKKRLIIAGTDPRGTAYGVFNISKKIGVNPWYWWADVPVVKKNKLEIDIDTSYSKEPSVAYRGIFLNDEDWGLQPWAANTFEPETGDIGPKTYAKLFELLLRLNANTIWPAMHPSTKAFFHYAGNPEMAKKYHIVVGSSHAEPMLRNNVDEWDEKQLGSFNYRTNKERVYNYWETRVKESKNMDAIYTIGMRGVHDSGMEGVENKQEAITVLNNVITDQRLLLEKYINKDISSVPQAFTLYKEVLDLYKNGLEIPDDITLVWTDDNYGYIRALGDAKEHKRTGGGGVYYHASYWGRPHDYLWLSTTSPSLIREEMMKAYDLDDKEIWILNVGDIKPAEYNTQLFMDMAYDAEKFKDAAYLEKHQQGFYADVFGAEVAKKIVDIRKIYYQLAFERKPEFMGWSQTEPTTSIHQTAYNPLVNGDEIKQRTVAYEMIENRADEIEERLPENLKSTYFQLVKYPIQASANMNKKFLYRDKALTYAGQFRKSASTYKERSNKAYKNIVALTGQYNQLTTGKWSGIMDMKPRNLPVFDNPEINIPDIYYKQLTGIAVEDTLKTAEGIDKLPNFYINNADAYFIDVYLKAANHAKWQFSKLPAWLRVSKTSGELAQELLEDRMYVSIDWDAWRKSGKPLSGIIHIEMHGMQKEIQVNVSASFTDIPKHSIIEKNGMAVIYAKSYTKNIPFKNSMWHEIKGLGHSKTVMQSMPFDKTPKAKPEKNAILEYELYAETLSNNAELAIVALPTHPLTTDGQVRIAVQWNDEPSEIINFKTAGRSETWKKNVLSNKALKKIVVPIKHKGKQKLKIYGIDPGVSLDYFILKTNSKELPYKLMQETTND